MKRIISGIALGLVCIGLIMYLLVAGFPSFTPYWLRLPIPSVWLIWATVFVGAMVLTASGVRGVEARREIK